MRIAGRDLAGGWGAAARIGALMAALIGLIVISGWLFDVRAFDPFWTGFVPMAPSSALLFLLFGTLELYQWRHHKNLASTRPLRLLSLIGLLTAAALLVLSSLDIYLGIERLGLAEDEMVAGALVGHMSPLTAGCFILAAITQLLLLVSDQDRSLLLRVRLAIFSSLLLTLASFVLLMAYVLGSPLLYGSGIIPPALTTSAAFMMLLASLFAPAAHLARKRDAHVDEERPARGGLMILIVLLAAAVILLAAWLYFDGYEQRFRLEASHELATTADLKMRELSHWRRERIGDAMVFHRNETFSSMVNRYLANPGSKDSERQLQEWLENVQEAYQYDRVALLDPDGRDILAVPKTSENPDSHLAEKVTQVLETGAIDFLDFHTHDDGMPYMGVMVPIGAGGTVEAASSVLLLRIDPFEYLYPMISRWPIDSETAETLLVRKDGEDVLFLNPLRFHDAPPLSFRIPLTRTDLPAARAVMGEEGIVEGRDYRDAPVMAAVGSITDSNWFLVARMDIGEIYAPLRERMWWIVFLSVAMLVLVGTVAAAFWQRNIKAHYREIHQAESRYKTTLNSIGDGVIVTDREGRVNLLNPVAESLTGWDAEEAVGRPLEEVFPIVNEDTGEVVQSPVEKVLEAGLVVGLANHTVLRSRNGREIPISDSGAPVHDREGRINGVVLVFSDQSGEREAKQRLREREAKYRGLFTSIRDAILVTGTDRRIVDCNPAFTDLFGYTVDEITGQKTRVLYESEEEFREMGRLLHENIDNPSFLQRINYRSRSGRIFPGETNVFYLKDADGGMIGFIGMIRDISERERQEKERESLRAQLHQSQKMESVGRLAGGVAHDFNNMLSVIIGNVELAMDRVETDDTLRSELERVHQSAMHSAALTRQLLAFARKQTIAPKVLDLNRTLEGMLGMLKRLIGENIELSWIPAEGLWNVRIDPSQIDQVLANLCVNAKDAVKSIGKITIETGNAEIDEEYCARHEGFKPGKFVTLSVSDNGCGMSREVQEHLFEPFFSTKGTGEGTGLGLATIYGIVRQNEGFINVYSEPGEGSTFRIYLPGYFGDEEVAGIPGGEMASEGGDETILVVEDEESLLQMSRMMLEKLGYNVLTASTPGEALELVKGHRDKIELLITDVIMPEMNGRELSNLLRKENPGLKTLFMSGYTANVIAHHGVLDRDVHFMEKPFSMKIFSSRVREALEKA